MGYMGLDFGTANSGFAFLPTNSRADDKPLVNIAWQSVLRAAGAPKTRSAILYEKSGSGVRSPPIAWGEEAFEKYTCMKPVEQRNHLLLQNFKLALSPNKDADYPELPVLTAHGLTPERVISDYLRYLVDFGRKYVLERSGAWDPETVWALTVPAGWGDGAKAVMRRAAVAAGMVVQPDSPKLHILHEPEAAALALKVHGELRSALKNGSTILVIDGGGGTVDLTWHTVVASGALTTLEDASHRECIVYGGSKMDEAFEALLVDELGSVYTRWKADPRNARHYLKLIYREWMHMKHIYKGDSSDITIELHPSLYSSAPQHLTDKWEAETGFSDRFPVPAHKVKAIFEGVVTRIMNRVTAMGQRMQSSKPDKVLLVGGLCDSPYLRSRLRSGLVSRFGVTEADVMAPACARSAIEEGAAIFAKTPSSISARRMTHAYCIETLRDYLPDDPPEYKVWNSFRNSYKCDNAAVIMVQKNEMVKIDERKVVFHAPSNQFQASVAFAIYRTTVLPVPKYVTHPGMEHVGTVRLNIRDPSAVQDPTKYSLEVTMLFGQGDILFSGRDVQTGLSVSTSIAYMD